MLGRWMSQGRSHGCTRISEDLAVPPVWRFVAIALLNFLFSPAARAETDAATPPAVLNLTEVKLTADDHGFRLASPGDPPPFEIALQALVQADARMFYGNAADVARDDILLRRMRPRLSGTVYGLVYFKLVTDFGDGDAMLTDAALDVHPWPWLRLMVGKFNPPLGLERLQSDATLPMAETGLDANLSVSRDVGLMLWGEIGDGLILYQVAVMDGAPDGVKQDNDNGVHKDFFGRVLIDPFAGNRELGALGLGFAASAGVRDGKASDPSLGSAKSPGQNRFFTYVSSDADPTATAFAQGMHTRLNLQLYYYYAGLGILAELVQSRLEVHTARAWATLVNRGGHATVSYVLGGRNTFEGAKADHPWQPSAGYFGAVELAARYSRLILDERAFPNFADPSKSPRGGDAIGVTLSWILGRLIRVVASFEHTRFEPSLSVQGTVQVRPSENVVISRLTLNL